MELFERREQLKKSGLGKVSERHPISQDRRSFGKEDALSMLLDFLFTVLIFGNSKR